MTPTAPGALRPAGAVDRDRLLATFLGLVAVDSPTGHEGSIGTVLEARYRELLHQDRASVLVQAARNEELRLVERFFERLHLGGDPRRHRLL